MERSIVIGVFCYNRAAKLKACIEALLKNPECSSLEVIFFSDGYKGDQDRRGVLEVRDYIESISGFKKVMKHFRDRNYSTGPNFQQGLNYLSENYDEFIIVEDDLLVSPNYIKFLLDGLSFYKKDKSVFCLTAFVFPLKTHDYRFDSVVYKRFCSYGWAGWSDRMNSVVWDVKVLKSWLNTPGFKAQLNAEGLDLVRMLKKQISGKISTWDIQMQTHVAQNRLKVIYPVLSKVANIGFDTESTNTYGMNYLVTPLDDGRKTDFNFCNSTMIDVKLQSQIKQPYTLGSLIFRKLGNEVIRLAYEIKKVIRSKRVGIKCLI